MSHAVAGADVRKETEQVREPIGQSPFENFVRSAGFVLLAAPEITASARI
jgi:hypothetical protein